MILRIVELGKFLKLLLEFALGVFNIDRSFQLTKERKEKKRKEKLTHKVFNLNVCFIEVENFVG